MKRLLVLSMLLFASQVNAQKVSLAVGAGGCFNGQPNGNLMYKGDQTLLNYALRAALIYTTQTNWQYGIVGHMHEMSSKSTKKYPGFPNRHLVVDSVGGDGKKLLYSKYTVAATAVLNKNFNVGPTTSIYLGAAIGWGYARNNSLNYKENESYVAADGGNGLTYGGQLGINTRLAPKVNFFLDCSFRYYNLDYDAGAPNVFPPEDLKYSILAVPITIGLNFDLHEVSESQRNSYNVKKRKYN